MKCEACRVEITTRAVRCAVCGATKYPALAVVPDRWICVLCRLAGEETVLARQEAAQRGRAAARLRSVEVQSAASETGAQG